jgi:hypothetical protein
VRSAGRPRTQEPVRTPCLAISNNVRKLEKAMNEEPDNLNTPVDGIQKNAVLRFHQDNYQFKIL